MQKQQLTEEFLQALANSIVRSTKRYLDWKQESKQILDLDGNVKKTHRDFVDSWIKRDIESGLIPFDSEINARNVGFGYKHFEYNGSTVYGKTLILVKKRDTLIDGFSKKEKTVHLIEHAKANSLCVDSSVDLLDILLAEENLEETTPSKGDYAFLSICFNFDELTEQISYVGIYTLDMKEGPVELQDFSHCLAAAYNMETGGLVKDLTPPTPPDNKYELTLREKQKTDE